MCLYNNAAFNTSGSQAGHNVKVRMRIVPNTKCIEIESGNNMEKKYQLTFHKADFTEYSYILKDDEIRNKIAAFLLKYVSIESFYKKLLISEKESKGKKLTVKEKNNLNVTVQDVKRVLAYFEICIDDELIERVIGSNDKNYMECSIKKLRYRLVHNINNNVLQCILERYDDMNKDLDAFHYLFF